MYTLHNMNTFEAITPQRGLNSPLDLLWTHCYKTAATEIPLDKQSICMKSRLLSTQIIYNEHVWTHSITAEAFSVAHVRNMTPIQDVFIRDSHEIRKSDDQMYQADKNMFSMYFELLKSPPGTEHYR